VLLNRSYKPVGFTSSDHVTYADFPVRAKLRGLGGATAARISYKGSADLSRIYLYNDSCVPTHNAANMNAYLRRLTIVAKLKTVSHG
jgi:hypothetical protein